MSLFDKLMTVDDAVVTEKRTKEVHSDRLSALLGVDTNVTIEALPYRKVKKILDDAMKNNGRIDPDRMVDAECHIIRLSVKEIPWGNEELQKKYGASDPKDLVEKLMDYDVGKLSDEIVLLSGYGEESIKETEEIEENVKN